MQNVLIIGLGSIGQRHFRNLKNIKKKISFYAIRKKKVSPKLSSSNEVLSKKFKCAENGIREIKLNEIKKYKIDTAFITNPTSLHLKTAYSMAKMNCNLFIEKPLSHNLNDTKKLLDIVNLRKLNCEIGFQTRYDDLLVKIKKIITSKKYGAIKKASITHRHYLPFHHKYEDYKKSYASRKDLGGGVLLCFSHEIDYASYLFNEINQIIPKKISSDKNLNVNVETSVLFTLIYGKQKIPVSFNLDFLKKTPQRKCVIQFTNTKLVWNLNKGKIEIFGKKKTIIKSKFKTRNQIFLNEIKKVYTAFNNNKNSKNTLPNAIKNLKIINDIKKSFKKI